LSEQRKLIKYLKSKGHMATFCEVFDSEDAQGLFNNFYFKGGRMVN